MTFNFFSDYLKHLPKDSEEFADTESTLLLLLLLFIYFFKVFLTYFLKRI